MGDVIDMLGRDKKPLENIVENMKLLNELTEETDDAGVSAAAHITIMALHAAVVTIVEIRDLKKQLAEIRDSKTCDSEIRDSPIDPCDDAA